ncbi:hypothetical protein Tco_1174737 [Tanacetum coccineum]
MSTSSAHQQSLVDAGSETLPPMLERGILNNSTRSNRDPRPETKEDLTSDALKQYEVDIEAMNLILIFIPNDIYNYVDSCQTAREMWLRVKRLMQGTTLFVADRETQFNNEFDQFLVEPGESLIVKKLEKTHDPFALVAHISSSSRSPPAYYVTHPPYVVDYDDDVILLQQTTDFAYLQTQEIKQFCKLTGSIFKSEMLEMMVELKDARIMFKKNLLRVVMFRKRLGKYKEIFKLLLLEILQMFSATIAVRKVTMLLEELSANICIMGRIQSVNIDSNEGSGYDFAFISEVQTSSTSYMNPLFTDSNHEQTYHEQPKIINSTISDDKINNDIIFDDTNMEVNNRSVEHDKHVHDSYKLEKFAKNAYKEAEKQQIIANSVKQQNVELTKQLEQYKERVRVFETKKVTKPNFQTEFIEGDRKAKLIIKYLVKISKKARILELKRRHLNITVLISYTSYPSRKIHRICACTSQETTKIQSPIRHIQESSIRRIQYKIDMAYSDQLNMAYRSSDTVVHDKEFNKGTINALQGSGMRISII